VKKYTIKEFAKGKKAVKIENEEQWNKLNKVHKLTPGYFKNAEYYTNIQTWFGPMFEFMNNWEVLEFSQLDFEDDKEKTMKKEIIGYKLKEEFLHCKEYAAHIGEYNNR